MWKQWQTLFLGAPKSLQMVTAAMKLKDTPWKKSYDQPRQHIKKQRHYFANKGPSSQGCGFSSSHIWIESGTVKKADRRRVDTFELWCWRWLLRVPWTVSRSNQSILKEISPEYLLGSSLSRVDGYPQDGRRWRMNDMGRPSFSERGL